jgi:putative nucleotidyltransferase with HDIG domain
MLSLWKRERLVKKGLCCAKKRRKQDSNELLESLEYGAWARYALLMVFALGLGLLILNGSGQAAHESLWQAMQTGGGELFKRYLGALLLMATALVHLWLNHSEVWRKNSSLLLILGSLLVNLILVKTVLYFADSGAIDIRIARLIIPFALAPMIISVLMGRSLGIFSVIYVSLLGAFLLRQPAFVAEYLPLSLLTGFVAVFMTTKVRSRQQMLKAGLGVGVATVVLGWALGMMETIHVGHLMGTDWKLIGAQNLSALLNGVLTATIVGGVLPLLESSFRITTDMQWLEMSDLNHPLLRRLNREAPGTYNHSMRVADLAEAAAESIGANPTMTRVCAYFHDIGKLVKPDYFTENIPADSDPHAELSPTMSALVIIAHVKEGVDLALRNNLNPRIVDVIQQHHGTSIVYYFYRRALDQAKAAREGKKLMDIHEDDIPQVREASFQYPGPKPQTREAAIILLADCIESASRSLEKPTPQKIDQFVKDMISARMQEGQLDESDLTLTDIKKLEETFRFTLQGMLHSRVAYPKREKREEQAARKTNPPDSALKPVVVTQPTDVTDTGSPSQTLGIPGFDNGASSYSKLGAQLHTGDTVRVPRLPGTPNPEQK